MVCIQHLPPHTSGMHVYLLRHGNAEPSGIGCPDEARALTAEGRECLERAGPTWRRLVEAPQVLWSSPLRRAQQTAALFASAVRRHGEPRSEPALLPEADPAATLALVEAENRAGTASLALVGHEPHLGYLFGLLATGHPRLSIPLKKGMLVGLEMASRASSLAQLRFVLTQRCAGELG